MRVRPVVGIPLLALLAAGALGQTTPDTRGYPVRPVRVIVPTPACGATDFTARVITQRLAEIECVEAPPPRVVG